MIRFFLILAFVLGSAQAANANICTIPTTLVNGTIVDASQLNGNFLSLQSCGNSVDSTNMGSSGIYASQIKPTTVAQAAFGGTVVYTFPAGLTVVGTTNLAATVFSTAPTMSGANINANTIPNGALVTTPLTGLTAGSNITLTGSAPNITISAATAAATPVYTVTGVAVTGIKIVQGTVLLSGATSIGIAFTGAAVFTSGTSYTCSANGVNANQAFWFNQPGGTAGGASTSLNTSASVTGTIPFTCVGT